MHEKKWYLKMHIETMGDIVTIDQERYREQNLIQFGMENCKPKSTPLPTVLAYKREEEGIEERKVNMEKWRKSVPYKQVVGALLHLARQDQIFNSRFYIARYASCYTLQN